MSAIVGIVQRDMESNPLDYGLRMMKSLEKYPADDIRVWQHQQVFLGCHVQWITPESIGERLPYYDQQRQLVITADAIIDNREELFERLQVARPYQKSMPDSELILLAYQKWGENCPKYLVGDFAFMIWDEQKQRAFGARDFSGGRTLYYVQTDQRFAFSTVIQPLFTLPDVAKQLNEQWLAEYLTIPGMNEAVDTYITVYTNIKQIPPSHSITVSGSGVKLSRYCTLTVKEQLKLKSNQEYVEAFRDVFQSAVNSRIRTHRQVGAHLSGGLDSGSVVSFAARALREENKELHTFSYVPPSDFIDWTSKSHLADERSFIKSTVDYVGNIRDHYYDFADVNPLIEIDGWLDTMEMPYKFFANSNWIKGIFEKANQVGAGVLLNGGRGNLSVSWGFALEYYAILLKKLRWIRLFQELHQYSQNAGGNRLRRLPVIGKLAFPYIAKAFVSTKMNQFPMLIHPELAKRTGVLDRIQSHGINLDEPSYALNIYDIRKKHFEELFSWNSTGTLGTKLSLQYSLWKRDPTNDIRVIRFCLSVPEEQYVQNGMDRALIRRSTENYLPEKVRLNQRIRGVQGADCIHRMAPFWNAFLEELELVVKDPVISELMNVQVIKAAISKFNQGPKREYAFDPDYQILMRSIIVYRFLKQWT